MIAAVQIVSAVRVTDAGPRPPLDAPRGAEEAIVATARFRMRSLAHDAAAALVLLAQTIERTRDPDARLTARGAAITAVLEMERGLRLTHTAPATQRRAIEMAADIDTASPALLRAWAGELDANREPT